MIAKTVRNQIPQPYSQCVPNENINTNLSREMNRLGMAYSRKNCFVLCVQMVNIQQHGCYDMRFPRIFNALPCNKKWDFEKLQLGVDLDNNPCDSVCPIECVTTKYDIAVSHLDLYSYGSYINNKHADYVASLFGTTNVTYEAYLKMQAGVNIKFTELKYTQIEESVAMSVYDLIGNVGGILGLFIGFALMVIVGFIEIIYKAVVICLTIQNNKANNQLDP